MIQAFYLPPQGKKPDRVSDIDQIVGLYGQRQGLLWIDLEDPSEAETDLLADRLGLHAVAVRACREVTSQPLVHNYDDYLFTVMHAVDLGSRGQGVATLEVDIFWGRHFVLTYHDDPIRAITEVKESCAANGSALMARGSDFLLHAILDEIIDNFTPTIERIDGLIEECEKEIFEKPGNAVLQRLMDLRRSAAYLIRIATAQRDVVGRVVRGEFPQVTKQALAYWRDAYDHLVRMVQAIEAQRDLVVSARDAYLSVVSNRLNEVMKVLTIIATIFIPITFIAGLYGMNFEWMPELHQRWGYPAALAAMASVVVGLLIYFRRKRWI